MHILRNVVVSVTALLFATTTFAGSNDEAKKLNEATAALQEIRNADNGIPESIWNKAECVVVIPGLKKAGFIVGGEFGSGVMSCRNNGTWGAPVFMEMKKGSAGLQAGVSSTDLVLMVMNRGGAEKLLGNKVTLGADASIAAGPVGRTASAGTDVQLSAQILSYSRSKGLFAGINLSGGTLNPDNSKNERVYGRYVSPKDIVFGTKQVQLTPEARTFTEVLSREALPTTGVK